MATTVASPPTAETDSADLARFGYRPVLHRKLGRYASFAAGFSFVSILTTIFQFFGFGYSFGGAAFFWTWPIVFAGQFLVALNFAELAARYPISGCIYQWSRRLGGEIVGWFAGWMMIIAQIVTAAAAAIALQVVLPSIWSGFQLIGEDTALTSPSGATNAVLLGSILLVITTTINVIGIDLMARINSIGVTIEIVGVAAVIGLFFVDAERGPDVVLSTEHAVPGPYWAAFLVSGLMAAYVMVGFDSAGELSEETKNPRRVAPRTILSALSVSALGGGLMMLGALMAAPSLSDGALATDGLAYVITAKLNSPAGTVLLGCVAVAVFVCTLAIQTAGSRLLFSMARDGKLPFARQLAAVHPRFGTPVLPAIVIGALGIVLLVVNLGNAAIFATLASVCIVSLYLAYLLVTVPLLRQRLKGWGRGDDVTDPSLFALGRFGIPVNAVAVVWGIAMVINLAWPRPEVYAPDGGGGWVLWAAPLFVLTVVSIGALVRWFVVSRPAADTAPATV
ncbi:amino acid permease [Nocardia puris]|uniref:Amino acid/polyamine/organocation transporter (APC superfamily) n=1 Tax=Nocardia puris TaxID=208602 RepID=A0A366D3F5_9NOCA|nr:amino acid permease [Nocardia puris]MBF6214867.1 amino acid permease [Nocardia puris]MBF6364125.1 amino acid permease [Nocardia puris]MBF6459054.1 amino acid permease [Nocardia puris]RBO84593.1 amino acid/polyamine/organocation transporter (APC superfamily) [Nocardia puris]